MFAGNLSADSLMDTFKNGKVSGQIWAGYINFNPELSGKPTTFATALGGRLKFETGKYYGFDTGVALYASHDISKLSGDSASNERNYQLSGVDGHYALIAEAYLDYTYENFKIRGGQQLINIPYADADDIRVTPNTFEGVFATYTYNYFSFIGAYLTRWQGPDAGVHEFIDLLEEGDGMAIAAVTYSADSIEAGLWYYDADKTADVIYADMIGIYALSENVELTGGVQFANQSEKESSGIEGRLFGAMASLDLSGVILSIAYNTISVDDGKEYFSGFGSGVGFVNMYEMSIGTFTFSQGARGWKAAIIYDFAKVGIDGFTLEYNNGEFEGDNYNKANEQNLILEYNPSETWDIVLVYTSLDDEYRDISEDDLGNPADSSFGRMLVRCDYKF